MFVYFCIWRFYMKFGLSKLAIGVALISCVSSAYALEINRHTLQLNQDQYV